MANPTVLTTTASSSPALPQRRSIAYVELLAAELGKLAFVLGKNDALDSEGIRQAEMANDLADTRPEAMLHAFAMARRECKFFPTVVELLELYMRSVAVVLDRERVERQRASDLADEADRAAAERDRAEHPEEHAELDAKLGDLQRRFIDRDARSRRLPEPTGKRIEIGNPEVSDCPHCGKPVPHGIRGLELLSSADLRAIADRRTQKEADFAALNEQVAEQQRQADATAEATRKRRRKS